MNLVAHKNFVVGVALRAAKNFFSPIFSFIGFLLRQQPKPPHTVRAKGTSEVNGGARARSGRTVTKRRCDSKQFLKKKKSF